MNVSGLSTLLFIQPAYQLKLKDMWGVYANYKRARVATMGNILHKWRLLTTFHKALKQFREHAKLVKRDKITRSQESWRRPPREGIKEVFGRVPRSWPRGNHAQK